jgi:hypothetical protein
MYNDVPAEEWLNESPDNVILIIPEQVNEKKAVALGFSKEYLTFLYNNNKDNWFFECAGNVINGTNDKPPMAKNTHDPYCGIPVDNDGMKGLVKTKQLLYIMKKTGIQTYVIEYNTVFTHTISQKNTDRDTLNYVSANHCQGGSTYLVYDLKIINEEATNTSIKPPTNWSTTYEGGWPLDP